MTLIELLIATALSLLLLGAVVQMFGSVGQSITDSRAMLESADRLRLTATRLQQDLAGVTVTMNPPRKPENNEGYFEYIEGPMTAANASTFAINTDNNNQGDTTVGDVDDILMFTTRSTGQPFVGKYAAGAGGVAQSDVAEVAWFVRGRTLYRRVLLVAPALSPTGSPFYGYNDISVSIQNGTLVANSLGDLTKRENRFAHQTGGFPYSPYVSTATWSATNVSNWTVLRLPTLCECSSTSWIPGGAVPGYGSPTILSPFGPGQFDAWRNPLPYSQFDPATGAYNGFYTAGAPTTGQRIADDVILTNVIGFDVKGWDPQAPVFSASSGTGLLRPGDSSYTAAWTAAWTASPTGPTVGQSVTVNGIVYTVASFGAYGDLGYGSTAYTPLLAGSLSHLGHPKSYLNTSATTARVYDTYSTHYETVALNPQPAGTTPGQAVNGFDDNGNGIVDDIVYNGAATDGENITAPPYPIPLRGIQVKIRVYEPDSRQVREVTVIQDFLSQ
jgi:type II secretory pathway component PulJ